MTTTRSEQETIDFAKQFALDITPPSVILLDGELGTGKTCFTRGLCEGLGGDPRQVSSPTFAIMQEYDIANNKRLVHIDAYRLSGEDELESIGWDELLQDKNAIIAIEWASRIKNAIQSNATSIHITHLGIQSREISIS
ncbi:MAG: tRNA (adenosine(37)-N6)-threonylcarbamoyltransferase complex ATPase subunit type 1 TsaE [Phycisphaerales bacterium]|jgi:tRNA threonylcarbamoyladenosine biosynthesis protein TsaE|nr:tRNA (adenosine(37)-N6)-threonylcarbamoyltransferase complex ATPase subunit type 1 TsaE [Phycisphaerales bacterium]